MVPGFVARVSAFEGVVARALAVVPAMVVSPRWVACTPVVPLAHVVL